MAGSNLLVKSTILLPRDAVAKDKLFHLHSFALSQAGSMKGSNKYTHEATERVTLTLPDLKVVTKKECLGSISL
jgi:hypothetical protein